jgi:DNA-binding winged helix-turn-helix (wHTH) protein
MTRGEGFERSLSKTRRWAVLAGVNHYHSADITDLHYCVSDAKELHDLLGSQSDFGYDPRRLTLLTSENALEADRTKRRSILGSLSEMAAKTAGDDMLLFYFAGHGVVVDGEAYILPADSCLGDLLKDTALSIRRVKEIMQHAKAHTKIILLDACHCGVELSSRAVSADEAGREFNRSVFQQAEGFAIFASSARSESTFEDTQKRHGVFTYYLLEALRGAANTRPHDRVISLNEVANYVTDQVQKWGEDHHVTLKPNLDYQGTGEIAICSAPDAGATDQEAVIPAFASLESPVISAFPGPVPVSAQEGMFCDRSAEVERIRKALAHSPKPCTVMQGERCIGKTSFLNRAKRVVEKERPGGRHFLPLSIEPSSVLSCSDFASELWHGLLSAVKARGANLPDNAETHFVFETYTRFADQLSALLKPIRPTAMLILVDEFDIITHQCSPLETSRIIGLIRYIVENREDIPIVFFFSTTRGLPTAYGSPFPADLFALHPFDRTESDKLILGLLKNWATIDDQGLAWLFDCAGGRPYFVKLLLSKVTELFPLMRDSSIIALDVLQEAAEAAKCSLRADDVLRDIYGTFLDDDERYVLLWLTSHGGALESEEVVQAGAAIEAAFKRLAQRDYVIRQANGSWRLQFTFLGQWLAAWPKYGPELERLQVPVLSKPATRQIEASHDLPNAIVKDGICVDLTTQGVYLDGKKLQDLPNQAYRGVLCLAQRAGQIVPKDEFASYVWRTDYYEGDDQRILTLVHRIRSALGDTRAPYRCLETIRKRGFRLQHATVVRTLARISG